MICIVVIMDRNLFHPTQGARALERESIVKIDEMETVRSNYVRILRCPPGQEGVR